MSPVHRHVGASCPIRLLCPSSGPSAQRPGQEAATPSVILSALTVRHLLGYLLLSCSDLFMILTGPIVSPRSSAPDPTLPGGWWCAFRSSLPPPSCPCPNMNIWRRQQKGHPLYAAGRPLNANSLPTGRPKAENGNRPVFPISQLSRSRMISMGGMQ